MTTWNIDTSHSAVNFTVRHMMFAKVRGSFARWSGTVELEGQELTAAKVSARVEAASIDTNEEKRDAHLRSADFFDVEKFPALTFRSAKVEKIGGDRYRMRGELGIHGVVREVTSEVEALGAGKDPWGNERLGFQAHATINRRDFGLTWNQALEAGGVLVGENVDIALDVQAVKAPSAAR